MAFKGINRMAYEREKTRAFGDSRSASNVLLPTLGNLQYNQSRVSTLAHTVLCTYRTPCLALVEWFQRA